VTRTTPSTSSSAIARRGITTRVSVDSGGAQGNLDSWVTYSSRYLSGDGRFVVFESTADDLVSGDTNGLADVFVHDRSNGATTRASVHSSGRQGNGFSQRPSISGDGLVVALESQAQNLVPGDVNGTHDAFVRVKRSGAPADHGYCSPKVNSQGCAPGDRVERGAERGGERRFLPHRRERAPSPAWTVPVVAWIGARARFSAARSASRRRSCERRCRTPAAIPRRAPATAPTRSTSARPTWPPGPDAGTTLYGQFLGHDGGFAPPNDVELTGGIRFTICP
jgi:hypothetical protein